MIQYQGHATKVRVSTSDGILPGKGKIQLKLGLNDDIEGLILTLHNVYYLPNSPCNLVNLRLFNNSGVYHDNIYKSLYQVGSKKILAQAKRWRNSFLLYPLNLSDGAVHLLKVDTDTYHPFYVFQMSISSLSALLSI